MVAVTAAKGLEARKTVLTYIIIIVQAAVRNTTPFLTGHEWHAGGRPATSLKCRKTWKHVFLDIEAASGAKWEHGVG